MSVTSVTEEVRTIQNAAIDKLSIGETLSRNVSNNTLIVISYLGKDDKNNWQVFKLTQNPGGHDMDVIFKKGYSSLEEARKVYWQFGY